MSSLLIAIAVALSYFLSLSSSTTTTTTTVTCNSTAFDNCNDLPTLGATLHWTYNYPATSSLSIAFTAPPPFPNGWVAWALNPTGSGMAGAQALIAFRPTSSSPILVSTLDIHSYHDITKGPISYNVTGIRAEESNGHITIFATWALPEGTRSVNQVWQVGPVVKGKPGKHEFQQPNLESKMKLDLVDGPSSSPAEAPVGSPGEPLLGDLAPEPAKGGAVRIGFRVSYVVLGFVVVSLF